MNMMKLWKGMSVVVVLVLCGTVPIAVKKAANEYDEALERYVNIVLIL